MIKRLVIIDNDVNQFTELRVPIIDELIKNNIHVYLIIPFDLNIKAKNLNVIKIHNINNIAGVIEALSRIYKINKKSHLQGVITFSARNHLIGLLSNIFLKINFIPVINGLGQMIKNSEKITILGFFFIKILKYSCKKIIVQNTHLLNLFRPNSHLIKGSGIKINNYESHINVCEIPTFVYLGRLLYAKGIKKLLLGSILAYKQGLKHKLQIYGSFEESFRGIGMKEFNKIINGYNHIEFHGFRENVDGIFRNISAAILPTEYGEGVPRVILSALKNGCPSIVSKNPGCTEVIHHGETGFIMENNDQESISLQLIRFASLPKKNKDEMSAKCKLAALDYDIDIISKKYADIFMKAIY